MLTKRRLKATGYRPFCTVQRHSHLAGMAGDLPLEDTQSAVLISPPLCFFAVASRFESSSKHVKRDNMQITGISVFLFLKESAFSADSLMVSEQLRVKSRALTSVRTFGILWSVSESVDYGHTKVGYVAAVAAGFPRGKQPDFPMGEIPKRQYSCKTSNQANKQTNPC